MLGHAGETGSGLVGTGPQRRDILEQGSQRSSVGWGLEHRPANRSCKSFCSLEKQREKEIAQESATATWTGEAQTGPASPWSCMRLGGEATETHCSRGNSLPIRNWFAKKTSDKTNKTHDGIKTLEQATKKCSGASILGWRYSEPVWTRS